MEKELYVKYVETTCDDQFYYFVCNDGMEIYCSNIQETLIFNAVEKDGIYYKSKRYWFVRQAIEFLNKNFELDNETLLKDSLCYKFDYHKQETIKKRFSKERLHATKINFDYKILRYKVYFNNDVILVLDITEPGSYIVNSLIFNNKKYSFNDKNAPFEVDIITGVIGRLAIVNPLNGNISLDITRFLSCWFNYFDYMVVDVYSNVLIKCKDLQQCLEVKRMVDKPRFIIKHNRPMMKKSYNYSKTLTYMLILNELKYTIIDKTLNEEVIKNG